MFDYYPHCAHLSYLKSDSHCLHPALHILNSAHNQNNTWVLCYGLIKYLQNKPPCLCVLLHAIIAQSDIISERWLVSSLAHGICKLLPRLGELPLLCTNVKPFPPLTNCTLYNRQAEATIVSGSSGMLWSMSALVPGISSCPYLIDTCSFIS